MPIIGGGGGGAAGGSGIGAVLFDSTLLADTASIDTGANGIAGGYKLLEIYITHRTDDAGSTSAVDITFNGDTSGAYGRQFLDVNNVAVAAAINLAAAALTVNSHGSGVSATHAATTRITIPNYAGTTFYKTGESLTARPDSAAAANNALDLYSIVYRVAAAITQATVAAQGAAKLKAGSRLTVLGF